MNEDIRTLIENGVKRRHRSMFVIVGDKSRDQIIKLHNILPKPGTESKTQVLWCSKNSHNTDTGQLDHGYSLPLDAMEVTYCMYKDSPSILGKTFGMCILQDFEALTPNLLAQTIETVEGGGLVVLLLQSLDSLTSLYTMVMDVHDTFRTESHSEIYGRFNERFLLSLATCKACVVVDDELNILPLSSHIRSISKVTTEEKPEGLSQAEQALKTVTDRINQKYDVDVGPLINMCCTLDQRQAVVSICDNILDKNLRSIVALIGSRGRGKSAALGLAVTEAVAAGYSNIYVTAPSPADLKTLFEFVCKGFKALKYEERLEYNVTRSDNPDFEEAIVRIDFFKQHMQTIQYIQPHEHEKLSQVELLVIDEATAIPLPVLKCLLLLGPYRVFFSSTDSGYEGTGTSLSLKLFQQLEEQCRAHVTGVKGSLSGCRLQKIELKEAIKYAYGDPIELWLNNLLCMTNCLPKLAGRIAKPTTSDLYYVNRDVLFSYQEDSELFLQQMMALCVSSHYKNSPNDLQMLADAPDHHLFVLLGCVDKSKAKLPNILCVLQVCLEGNISPESAKKSLNDGHSPHGDQIQWKFSEQFRDLVFPTYSGARIVRIAVHPDLVSKGYGSIAVELLTRYFERKQSKDDDELEVEASPVRVTEAAKKASLHEEEIKSRANLLPLLVDLKDRRPERLHYLAVSFGLTFDLFRFWRKQKFAPFYINQITSDVTGEHTCMLLKSLNNDESKVSKSNELGFFAPYYEDFRKRFSKLLSDKFKKMDYKLAMIVLNPKIDFPDVDSSGISPDGFLKKLFSPHDMERLRAYNNNPVDFNLVNDLCKTLAHYYFQEEIPVSLSYDEASVLLWVGLQELDFSSIKRRMLPLEMEKIHSNLLEVGQKFYKYLHRIVTKEMTSTLPRLNERLLEPRNVSVDEDVREMTKEVEVEASQKSKIPTSGNISTEVVRRTSSRPRRQNPNYPK